MIAIDPSHRGLVRRDGVRLAYAVYGAGGPTVLLLPTWSLYHSRFWKFQVPYLARHFRVITFDGRGSGESDGPSGPNAYTDREFAADAVAVLDATGTDAAVAVGFSCGAMWALRLAAEHPDRALALVLFSPAVPLAPQLPERDVQDFHASIDDPDGWQKYNAAYWRANYADFVEFMVGRISSERHSTKQFDDGVEWAMEIDPEVLIAADLGLNGFDEQCTRELAARVACPSLVIHGTDDRVRSVEQGVALAELLGADLLTVEGAGHDVMARQPVLVNRALKNFIDLCTNGASRDARTPA